MGYTYNCVTSPTFPLALLHFLHKNTPTTAATLAADTPTSNCVRLSIGQFEERMYIILCLRLQLLTSHLTIKDTLAHPLLIIIPDITRCVYVTNDS